MRFYFAPSPISLFLAPKTQKGWFFATSSTTIIQLIHFISMASPIIDNKYLLAEWRNEGTIFYYAWKGFVPGPAMRANLEEILAVFAQGQTPCMLQDLTQVRAVAPEDQDWITTNWVPRAMTAGMRKVAMLTPASVFGQIASQNVQVKVAVNGLDLYNQFFDDYAKAEAWLLGGD
jgi:hypothetical protein